MKQASSQGKGKDPKIPFSPQDLEFIKILLDPVLFAKYHFDWEARWYQDRMLRNKSLRKVSRCGRRTGKTDAICVDIIWRAYTNKDYKILVATPYESQVKVIFDRIRELIKKSKEISQSVVSDTKHPDCIKFSNGSTIRGFTSGTKSGAQGGSMRGQSANFIYMDEMDYMSDEDVHTITTIAAQNDTIGIWASSTPTGRRGKFYQFCVEAQGGKQDVEPDVYECDIEYTTDKGEKKTRRSYTAFYFPTTVSPDWNDKMEDEFRINLSEDAYDHEILANFGIEVVGVYNKEFLDRAKQDYAYLENPQHRALRGIAVDWDVVQATPTICVIEYDPFAENTSGEQGMFKVINRVSIPRSEFTLDAAVKRIVEFNGIYKPAFIYVDKGFGYYQLETLHIKGLEATGPEDPAWKLDEIVKGFTFSDKIEVRDPATSVIQKKDIKPFMVNQAVLMFEQDRVILNVNDRLLWRQMENYQVEKISIDGRPTYTNKDEHCVDSFNLCMLGFVLEFPDIAQTIQQPRVTRRVIVAPPIKRSEPNLGKAPEKPVDPEDKEKFANLKIARYNSPPPQVLSLQDLRNNRSREPIVRPRGSNRSAKPFTRTKF